MTERFIEAHEFTSLWEGGLSEHKNDPGGITNHGVSLRWLIQLEEGAHKEFQKLAATCDGSNKWDSPYDFNMDDVVDSKDIKACSKKQAAQLMHDNFWNPLYCDHLPIPLGLILYDSAVNMGATRATRILQEVANIAGEAHLDIFVPLKTDGICGPKTISLCASLKEFGLDFYVARMAVRQRINFYINLSRNNESLAVFLSGWKNRCQALLEHLAMIEREAY